MEMPNDWIIMGDLNTILDPREYRSSYKNNKWAIQIRILIRRLLSFINLIDL